VSEKPPRDARPEQVKTQPRAEIEIAAAECANDFLPNVLRNNAVPLQCASVLAAPGRRLCQGGTCSSWRSLRPPGWCVVT